MSANLDDGFEFSTEDIDVQEVEHLANYPRIEFVSGRHCGLYLGFDVDTENFIKPSRVTLDGTEYELVNSDEDVSKYIEKTMDFEKPLAKPR